MIRTKEEIVQDYLLLEQMQNLETLLKMFEQEQGVSRMMITIRGNEYEFYHKGFLEATQQFIEEQIAAIEVGLKLVKYETEDLTNAEDE